MQFRHIGNKRLACILVLETSTLSTTTKSKAMNAHATGVGFTRIFGCQVVEDLKNKLSGFVRAFLLYVLEKYFRA